MEHYTSLPKNLSRRIKGSEESRLVANDSDSSLSSDGAQGVYSGQRGCAVGC